MGSETPNLVDRSDTTRASRRAQCNASVRTECANSRCAQERGKRKSAKRAARSAQRETHLREANRLLEDLWANAPPQDRESMLANVPLHRDIRRAAQEAGL